MDKTFKYKNYKVHFESTSRDGSSYDVKIFFPEGDFSDVKKNIKASEVEKYLEIAKKEIREYETKHNIESEPEKVPDNDLTHAKKEIEAIIKKLMKIKEKL